MTGWREKLALTAQRNRQEIVKAKLSRREMVRLGLLTAGGGLIVKKGLSARAFADDGSLTFVKGVDGPPSPPTTPWAQPMPILPIKASVNPFDPKQMPNGPPDGTTLINGATQRVPHQFFTFDPETNTFGGQFPPKKFYQLNMQEQGIKVHPTYAPTTFWGFDGMVPGPLIQARYGEPIVVRFQNNLPSVKKPQSFGIAEMTTHLHNGHTPTESDGNPVDFFNSVKDPNALNPLGFKDQHYPNVYAGYTALGKGYRFRLYNPGPSRWWEFALYDGSNFLPFWQISTDGNLLPNAVQVSSVRLGVAERADIIVDFSKISAQRLYIVNRLEQVNGRGPTGKLLTPGTMVVQINVGSAKTDNSVDPSGGGTGNVGIPLRTLPDPDFAALQTLAAKAKTRTWQFERGNGAWQVNGRFFDPDVVNASIDVESDEVWVIQNPGGGWRHPVHIHFEEHRVLSRDGVPIKPNTLVNGTIDYARRDVVPLNDNNEVRIFFRFRDMKGRYVMHCHNVVHEDHAMMIRWDTVS